MAKRAIVRKGKQTIEGGKRVKEIGKREMKREGLQEGGKREAKEIKLTTQDEYASCPMLSSPSDIVSVFVMVEV